MNGNDTWGGPKRRTSYGQVSGTRLDESDTEKGPSTAGIKEEDEESGTKPGSQMNGSPSGPDSANHSQIPAVDAENIQERVDKLSLGTSTNEPVTAGDVRTEGLTNDQPVATQNFAAIQWTYLDPAGNVQGTWK